MKKESFLKKTEEFTVDILNINSHQYYQYLIGIYKTTIVKVFTETNSYYDINSNLIVMVIIMKE